MSPPELLLWGYLRGKGLGGLKFRRQHPMGRYVQDFYCPAANLVIEIDGEGHGHGRMNRRRRFAPPLAGEGRRRKRGSVSERSATEGRPRA